MISLVEHLATALSRVPKRSVAEHGRLASVINRTLFHSLITMYQRIRIGVGWNLTRIES